MDPNSSTSKDRNKDKKTDKSNSILQSIKSNYFLEKIYDSILRKKSLDIVRWNKKLQGRLNLRLKDYKEFSEIYSSIEIEIIPCNNQYGCPFINIKENEKAFYHIFFNNNKEEIKNKYTIRRKDKTTKITIVIDYQVKSFANLFENCECIKSINFKKFHRINIENMEYMFYGCPLLEEINLLNFKTNSVSNMNNMFNRCKLLKELNLSNFNTSNVEDMGFLFTNCYKLKEIKGIENFNTIKVKNMTTMFQNCNELEYLDLSNFNTSNVEDGNKRNRKF